MSIEVVISRLGSTSASISVRESIQMCWKVEISPKTLAWEGTWELSQNSEDSPDCTYKHWWTGHVALSWTWSLDFVYMSHGICLIFILSSLSSFPPPSLFLSSLLSFSLSFCFCLPLSFPPSLSYFTSPRFWIYQAPDTTDHGHVDRNSTPELSLQFHPFPGFNFLFKYVRYLTHTYTYVCQVMNK